jgi:hypothetical protein
MALATDDAWIFGGGLAPAIIAGLVTGTIALVLTGDLLRGAAFFLGIGLTVACAPRIKNALLVFWRGQSAR